MFKSWALIKDGVIVNTVLALDSDNKDPNYIWIPVTGTCIGINWTTSDNINFTSPDGSLTVGLNG